MLNLQNPLIVTQMARFVRNFWLHQLVRSVPRLLHPALAHRERVSDQLDWCHSAVPSPVYGYLRRQAGGPRIFSRDHLLRISFICVLVRRVPLGVFVFKR